MQAKPEQIRKWAFELIFCGLAVYAASPVWEVAHPAIQDLPQHLAAARVLADYNDPDLAFAQYFTIDLTRTQYLAYYLAAIVLSWPFGVLLANKILITVSIVATPYALRSLLAATDRDTRLALFAIPLTWNAHLILGFMNFTAAIPLAMFGLALAAKLRVDWTRGRAIGLGVITFICFYTHVVPFAFLGLGAAMVGFEWKGSQLKEYRGTLMRWLPLIPAALSAIIWTQLSPAGESTVSAASGGGARGSAVFQSPRQALDAIPMWLTDVLQTDVDDMLLVAFGVTFLFATVSGFVGDEARPRPTTHSIPPSVRRRLQVLGPLAAALYFLTPASYDWIWPINARFPLLAIMFSIPALPRQRGVIGAGVLAGIMAISVLSTAEVSRAFVAFEEEEVGALDEAIAEIPHGARVAGLIYDRGSRYVKFSPFIHSVAWVQAENGGAVMFTFADFPVSAFVFREDNRPPRVQPRWEWTPEQVSPRRDLAWYDYVLVRGGPGRIGSPNEPYERVFTSERWSVFRRLREP